MMPQDPTVGGTVLRRAAIQSPNYVAGTSGWVIFADGSAEFNDVTIRGGVIEDSPGLYYNGTPGPGTLIVSVGQPAKTVDQYGNTVQPGACVYGANGTYVDLTSIGGGSAEIYLSTGDASEANPAIFGTSITGEGVTRQLGGWIQSPAFVGDAPGYGYVQLYSPTFDNTTGSALAEIGAQDGPNDTYATVSLDAGKTAPFFAIYTSASNTPTNAAIVVDSGGNLILDQAHAMEPGQSTPTPAAWKFPALPTGWKTGDTGHPGIRYLKEPNGKVTLDVDLAATAAVAAGSTLTLCTLPPGWAPAIPHRDVIYVGATTDHTACLLQVNTDGTVVVDTMPAVTTSTRMGRIATIPLD